MTDLMPIVEILADCQTDAARADWLLRAPQGVIYRDHTTIRRVLQEAHFSRPCPSPRAFQHFALASPLGA